MAKPGDMAKGGVWLVCLLKFSEGTTGHKPMEPAPSWDGTLPSFLVTRRHFPFVLFSQDIPCPPTKPLGTGLWSKMAQGSNSSYNMF